MRNLVHFVMTSRGTSLPFTELYSLKEKPCIFWNAGLTGLYKLII